jgi:hypothetical protein
MIRLCNASGMMNISSVQVFAFFAFLPPLLLEVNAVSWPVTTEDSALWSAPKLAR